MANARPAYHLKQEPGGGAYRSRCRQVATFNGVSQYVSIPLVTLSGDFEIEMAFSPALVAAHLLADNTADAKSRIFYSGDDSKLEVFMSDSTLVRFAWNSVVNSLLNLEIKRVSSVWSAVLNGQSLGITSGQGSAGHLNINSICDQFGSPTGLSRFEGDMFGLKIWDGGDRNTGTLVRDYPLNDGFANNPTIRDLANNQDGTAINFTEATWSERCDL